MGKLPGISHERAVRALQRAGFFIRRQSGHIVLGKGDLEVVVPRNNPINPFTMYGIVKVLVCPLNNFVTSSSSQ